MARSAAATAAIAALFPPTAAASAFRSSWPATGKELAHYPEVGRGETPAFLPGGASTAVYAAAGWAGLPLLTFVLWDTLGSAAWISVVAFGGYLLGSDGVTLAELASRYATVTIVVLVAMLVAPQAWHSWREWRAGKAAATGGVAAPPVPAPASEGMDPQ